MKYVVLAVRLLFGVWYVMSGLRGFSPDMPMGTDPVAKELLQALVDSQLMTAVKVIELGLGVLLLANLFVPLALVVAFPVTVIVAYVCLVLEWPSTRPMIGGGGSLLAHVFLLFAYLDYYKPLFAPKARPLGVKA